MQQEEQQAAIPFQLGTRFLGKTGVLVSELCMGTMTFSKD